MRGKEKSVFFTLSCDRGAASQIDWNNVDAKGLKTLCNYTQQVELPFTGLHGPTGVAVDTAGNVYVTDDRNNRVLRLPAGTNWMGSHLTHTNPVELPLNVQVPSNVAVIAGDVYVTDNSRVLKLPAGGDTPIELPFVVPVPMGVAVDNAGDVYVTDGGNGRVLKLSAWSTTQVEVPFGGDLEGIARWRGSGQRRQRLRRGQGQCVETVGGSEHPDQAAVRRFKESQRGGRGHRGQHLRHRRPR